MLDILTQPISGKVFAAIVFTFVIGVMIMALRKK